MILKAVHGATHGDVLRSFFDGTWADTRDYFEGLKRAGHSRVLAEIDKELDPDLSSNDFATLLLTSMPDGDFLTASESGLSAQFLPWDFDPVLDAINEVCERRGVPYRISKAGRFEWVGDPVVEEQVLAPAVSALHDARLSAARSDFDSARQQLREGTPAAQKIAVAEACSAVESGLKALLREHGQEMPARQNLDALIEACRDAELFPPAVDGGGVPVEQILAGPGRVGNRRGRHGSHVPHDVEPDEAEAVVASAAVALTLIARRLPTT